MKFAVKLSGYGMMLLGLLVIIVADSTRWWHPELTEMQIFLNNWEFFLAGIVLGLLGFTLMAVNGCLDEYNS